MDLLNLHQPWDCERFSKSKTICYGGSGGGGGFSFSSPSVSISTPKITTPKIKIDPPKIKIDPPKLPKITTPKITTPKVDVGSALTGVASGITASANTVGKAVSSGVSGASSTIESIKKDVANSDIGKGVSAGVENIKKEGTKATEHIKSEAGKLAKGDFSLKKSIQGTASGIEETFKKSDLGKAVKTIADKSGYTGSDLDNALQKVGKEGANVVNQTLDVIDQPGKYVSGKLEEFKQYAAERFGYAKEEKKTARPKSRSAAPGSDRTIGQGGIEGLKGGGSLAASERSRIRQNKRKLRIART